MFFMSRIEVFFVYLDLISLNTCAVFLVKLNTCFWKLWIIISHEVDLFSFFGHSSNSLRLSVSCSVSIINFLYAIEYSDANSYGVCFGN